MNNPSPALSPAAAPAASAAMEFLLTRRSRPLRFLSAPGPDRAALGPILTAAARVPDHGKLEPWRFVVLEPPALRRLGALVADRAAVLGLDAEAAAKAREAWDTSPLAVVVVSCPRDHPKVPQVEQLLSAGAACLSLLNAALASGWGASWLTGWPVFDREFVETGLGLAAQETVAGVIHIGTVAAVPPDRPRPDLDRIVTWVAE